MKRFRGGLVFKAHRLSYHSTLGLRVVKKKRSQDVPGAAGIFNGGPSFGAILHHTQMTNIRNVQRFRGGLVFKAHRLLFHSTPFLRVIKKRNIIDEISGRHVRAGARHDDGHELAD